MSCNSGNKFEFSQAFLPLCAGIAYNDSASILGAISLNSLLRVQEGFGIRSRIGHIPRAQFPAPGISAANSP
jgi:hypothetical protein